jgi:hypothetical protein
LIITTTKEPPLADGSKRVKSSADLDIVGNEVNSFLPIVVSAPPLPNTLFLEPVTLLRKLLTHII